MGNLFFRDESYRIVGACFEVYNDKGHCFTEPIYHECLELEFAHRGIPFFSKPPITLRYRGQTLLQTFQADFICFERIIVELKAVESLNDKHRAQLVNYLHAADCDLGLLINFGSYPALQHERLVHSRHLKGDRNEPPDLSR